MRTACFALAAATLFSIGIVSAPAADSPLRDFGFGKMEIYKINRGTRSLKAEDVDGDGLGDIVFLNNTKSRLEILFRRKKQLADDSDQIDDVFDNAGMMLDQQVAMYRLADMDNDGRTDVITLGSPLGLFLRRQTKKRQFAPPERIFLSDVSSVMTLQAGDINGDGTIDIVVSRRNGAEILWNDSKHSFLKHTEIPYADDKCVWVELVDADKDGKLDLLQYYNSTEIPMRLRRGDGHGNFGPSNMLRVPKMRSVSVIRPRDKDPLMLAGIMNNALGMRLYGFKKNPGSKLMQSQEFTPQTLPVPKKGGASRLPWLAADFNSDGYDDLLVASPATSRICFYKGCEQGLDVSPKKYDTLSEIKGMNLLKNNDLLVVSGKEKAVAIQRHDKLDKFPDILKIKGELVAATAITGTRSIFVLQRSDDKLALECYNDTTLEKSLPIELDNDPGSMCAFSMPDGRDAIMLFIDYGPPEMLLVNTNSIEKLKSSRFRALSNNLKPYQVMEMEPGSGERLMVSHGTTVREYQWKNDAYSIVRQFNPINELAEVYSSCLYHNGKDKGLMAYDRKGKNLLFFSFSEPGQPRKIHLAAGNGNFTGIVQLKNKKRSTLVMLGENEMALLVDGHKDITLAELGEYTSKSEKPSLRFCRPIRISSPPRPAIAIADANNGNIEIVKKTKSGIEHELTFTVFLKSDMVGPVQRHLTEPHDIASSDINGDGIDDIVLLVHKNLIVYPGQ